MGRVPATFRQLAHPLAQIQAAYDFYGSVRAFVDDEWHELYTDAAPTQAIEEELSPIDALDALARLGLRFELAGWTPEERDFTESYWSRCLPDSSFDRLLYGWAFRFADEVEVDFRAVEQGLMCTDLLIIPDDDRLASKAYMLLLDGGLDEAAVMERHRAFSERQARLFRKERGGERREHSRGEGPRASRRALADKIAVALRDAGEPLSPEEVARKVRHPNLASVTAALHQIVAYNKPKRLAGWLTRADGGRYAWVPGDEE